MSYKTTSGICPEAIFVVKHDVLTATKLLCENAPIHCHIHYQNDLCERNITVQSTSHNDNDYVDKHVASWTIIRKNATDFLVGPKTNKKQKKKQKLKKNKQKKPELLPMWAGL